VIWTRSSILPSLVLISWLVRVVWRHEKWPFPMLDLTAHTTVLALTRSLWLGLVASSANIQTIVYGWRLSLQVRLHIDQPPITRLTCLISLLASAVVPDNVVRAKCWTNLLHHFLTALTNNDEGEYELWNSCLIDWSRYELRIVRKTTVRDRPKGDIIYLF
jgi:hypothetical protein